MNLRSDPTVITSSPPVDVLTSFDLREVQAELEQVRSSSRIALPLAVSRDDVEVAEVLALCGDLDRSSLSVVLPREEKVERWTAESLLWFAGGFVISSLAFAATILAVLHTL